LRDKVRQAAEAAEADAKLLRAAVDIRSAEADDPDGSVSDAAYAAAFRDAGLDVDTLGPDAAGARIRARPPGVALAIAATLDHWASQRRWVLPRDEAGWGRLSATARAADRDETRDRLRAIWAQADRKAQRGPLLELAKAADPQAWPPASLMMLAKGLYFADERDAAIDLLRRAQAHQPGDVWLSYQLASWLEAAHPPRMEEAIGYYRAARALRPETAHELAHLLERRGRAEEAVAVFQDLVRLRRDNGRHWGCYGRLLKDRGDRAGAAAALEKAVAALREAIRLKPDDAGAHNSLGAVLCDVKRDYTGAEVEFREAIRLEPDLASAHFNLGIALRGRGMLAEAVAAYREATRLRPDDASAHLKLGNALSDQGKVAEAIAELREAIRLEPDRAAAHNSLGAVLCDVRRDYTGAEAEFREAIRIKPDLAIPHTNLGRALSGQGKLAEAIAEHREAIRLRPDDASAHFNLGIALRGQGKLAEAAAAYREAIRLEPDDADAHLNLGNALSGQGKLAEAVTAYREAIRLRPDDAGAHNSLGAVLCDVKRDYTGAEVEFREAIRLRPDLASAHFNLGIALRGQGEVTEAIAEYREAIRLRPDDAEAHCNLGRALLQQGRFREALDERRSGHELGSKRPDWRYPSAEWVRQAERLVALEARLPAVIRGEDKPRDGTEGTALADMAYKAGRNGASARLYGGAFESDPKLAEDMNSGNRYTAACAAALAGAGRDEDKLTDEASKARWRKQAVAWLKADLAHWGQHAEGGKAESKGRIVRKLRHWKDDADLAGLRDEAALKALPEEEQQACRALWAEVDALLRKAQGP
jgi:Flp pilus assembly protein TadD